MTTDRRNLQGPRQLRVEVREPDAGRALATPLQPERARCLPAPVRLRQLAQHPPPGRVARRLRAQTGGSPQGGP